MSQFTTIKFPIFIREELHKKILSIKNTKLNHNEFQFVNIMSNN